MTDVSINLMWLRPGLTGGSENFAINLLKAIAENKSPIRIEIVAPINVFEAYPFLSTEFETKVTKVQSNRVRRVIAENLMFRNHKSSSMVHHMGGTAARTPSDIKSVTTIYDLQFLEYPENFSVPKKLFLSKAVPAAIKGSNVICVTSKFVAESVIDRFDIPENSIRIIKPSITAPESVTESSGIKTPFVLFPAVTWPHKGHKFLIKVMELAEPDVTLVLTGGRGRAHSEVMQCISKSNATNRIVHLGSVASTKLEALYADALALVFPSEYEGFGQPLVEAMARGCPVISSDGGAIPEIVGDGGVTLPKDELIWAEEISQLKNKSHRENLRKRGLSRSKQFTSTKAAASQVAVYNSMIAL